MTVIMSQFLSRLLKPDVSNQTRAHTDTMHELANRDVSELDYSRQFENSVEHADKN